MSVDAIVTGDDELLTPQEVAHMLKRTKRWVYDASASRELPVIRVGRELRFQRSEIAAYLERQRTAAKA